MIQFYDMKCGEKWKHIEKFRWFANTQRENACQILNNIVQILNVIALSCGSYWLLNRIEVVIYVIAHQMDRPTVRRTNEEAKKNRLKKLKRSESHFKTKFAFMSINHVLTALFVILLYVEIKRYYYY